MSDVIMWCDISLKNTDKETEVTVSVNPHMLHLEFNQVLCFVQLIYQTWDKVLLAKAID